MLSLLFTPVIPAPRSREESCNQLIFLLPNVGEGIEIYPSYLASPFPPKADPPLAREGEDVPATAGTGEGDGG